MNYETVIGLEVHTELLTKTKIFCSCTTQFGAEPNTHVCEVCMGLPGSLPVLNKKVVELAIRAGLATNCEIKKYNKFDRKNYFYPDLPKAYQISQLYLPICQNGFVEISNKRIRIKEIHMEEDAGKLIHSESGKTLVDYNRCGVPLLEIVSEPDMRNADEVIEYLENLKALLQYTGVSDCKMQEGSLRADINLSVRPVGQRILGVRTEMKNMSSFRAIKRAIEAESKRQIELLEKGEKVLQQTRRWDESKNESFAMRTKEQTTDYKYFPEPDLIPVLISDSQIENIKSNLPELPNDKKKRYKEEYHLPENDIKILTDSLNLSILFEKTAEFCGDHKESAKWILGEVLRLARENQTSEDDIDFNFESLGKIIIMLKDGKINRGTAKAVFEKVYCEGIDAVSYIKKNNLELITDTEAIKSVIADVIKNNKKSVSEYKNGKTQALQYLIGQSMKALNGKALAEAVSKILIEQISKEVI